MEKDKFDSKTLLRPYSFSNGENLCIEEKFTRKKYLLNKKQLYLRMFL